MEKLYEWVEDVLEKIQFENEKVEHRCCYTEKLIKPWKNPSFVSDVTADDTATVVKEPVVDKNIQQIDNLLKKAKSVRSHKLSKPTDVLMTKKMKSRKKIKEERETKESFLVSSELTKVKEIPIKENLDPCHKKFIPLEEAINKFSLPKELNKLDYLTRQLKQQKAFGSHFLLSKPSKEEINFLKALNGGIKTTLTLDAALQMINNITLLCNRLIFVLRTDYGSQNLSSILQNRKNELILKKVDLITKNIIETCDYISNSTIIPNTSSKSSYDHILDSSTLFPCKEILYETTNEPKKFLQNLYQVESLEMLMLVQKKPFECLKKVLEETVLDDEDLRSKFLLAYKHVFGAFAQKASVTLPTVVLCQ